MVERKLLPLASAALPDGIYTVEITDFRLERTHELTVVWTLKIIQSSQDLPHDLLVQYSYPANLDALLTATNFKVLNFSHETIKAVLADKSLLSGRMCILEACDKGGDIRFVRDLSPEKMIVTIPAIIPF